MRSSAVSPPSAEVEVAQDAVEDVCSSGFPTGDGQGILSALSMGTDFAELLKKKQLNKIVLN